MFEQLTCPLCTFYMKFPFFCIVSLRTFFSTPFDFFFFFGKSHCFRLYFTNKVHKQTLQSSQTNITNKFAIKLHKQVLQTNFTKFTIKFYKQTSRNFKKQTIVIYVGNTTLVIMYGFDSLTSHNSHTFRNRLHYTGVCRMEFNSLKRTGSFVWELIGCMFVMDNTLYLVTD